MIKDMLKLTVISLVNVIISLVLMIWFYATFTADWEGKKKLREAIHISILS